MRTLIGGLLLAAAFSLMTASSHAQAPARTPRVTIAAPGDVYAPPGNYGVSYGWASYGSIRTYSAYSSPYGGGYGYGYPPATVLPGAFGAGLWRAGASAPGYMYGANGYSTFTYPYKAGAWSPAVGAYAPGFGPGFQSPVMFGP